MASHIGSSCNSDANCKPAQYCYENRICTDCIDCSFYVQENIVQCAKLRTDCGNCLQGFVDADPSSTLLNGKLQCIMHQTNEDVENHFIITYIVLGLVICFILISIIIFLVRYLRRNQNTDGDIERDNDDGAIGSKRLLPKLKQSIERRVLANTAKINEVRQSATPFIPETPEMADRNNENNNVNFPNQNPVQDDELLQNLRPAEEVSSSTIPENRATNIPLPEKDCAYGINLSVCVNNNNMNMLYNNIGRDTDDGKRSLIII